MIPTYLHDLHLPQVFAAYTASVEKHLLQSTKDEHIVDAKDRKVSGFVTATFGQAEDAAGKYFAVENPTGQPYALLQIDHGIIRTPDTKKCDCAIANSTSLCFIEFKTDAFSSNPSVLQRNYSKAIEQLTTTINCFDTHLETTGQDIRHLRQVEAYICFRQGYPRITSAQMNYQVAFATANNGIPLSFARKKTL